MGSASASPAHDKESDNDTHDVEVDHEHDHTAKKVSCQPCREAKVKCIPASSDSREAACSRCRKMGRECFYREHKRGRKPGKIKLQQIIRRLEVLDRTLAEIRELNREVGDEDASSLVETLSWQLHRSKFFDKGGRLDESTIAFPSSSSSSSALGAGDRDRERERERMQSEGVSRERGVRGDAEGSRMVRSRSDLNMLVDMEDHASVARVPDEFPTLSNPLKLLAQASTDHQSKSFETRKRPRSPSPSPSPSASSHRKASSDTRWASTYFSRGAFHPAYDNRPDVDPISCSILTPHTATRLLTRFYDNFGTFMHIFDPTLSTLTYIRKHSAFLLTVICAVSAEFDTNAESHELAARLRAHYESMLPWVTSGECKNVEMAQAFFLLASYRPMAENAMSDQTWLFLGTAIRIATELGCNLVCYSYSNSGIDGKGDKGEHYLRQLRNTERLWINLWNLEKTLASQTGQRMHLADEGVIATCSRWHRMQTSLRQDEVLVAQVELRRVMISMGDEFNTHVLRSLGARRGVASSKPCHTGDGEGEDILKSAEREQLSLQLRYFRNSVQMDLKRWEERWLPAPTQTDTSSPPTPLQITGPLSLDYAALVTYALPLPITYSVDVSAELTALYRLCYVSCTNYMATFTDRSQRGWMDYVTNSFIVSTVYAVVFAFDLVRKANKTRGKDKAKGGIDFGFVSRSRVVKLARLTSGELGRIGGKGRRSVAAKYAVFLNGVLARFGADESEGEEDSPPQPQSQSQTLLQGQAQGWMPPHHHHSQHSTGQVLYPNPNPNHDVPTTQVFSPASWFNHLNQATANTPAAGGGNAQPPLHANANANAPFASLPPDPQWEWMMRDLDFFSVDGGGGAGEPILDQMGRLFGQ